MAPIYSFGQPTNCTVEENDGIFIVTMKGDGADDLHLLNPSLIVSLLSALDHVKSRATDASVLITTADGAENFTRGFDTRYAEEACSNEDYTNRYLEMINLFKKVVSELISFPMPTIAAINGYACGAGLMLALSHDYIKISPERDLLQLTELDTRMTLPEYFTALIRAKVGPGARSRLALRGLKFQAGDAREMGIVVEEPRISEMPLETAKTQAETLLEDCWDGKVYAEIRKSLYPELCLALGLTFTPFLPSKL